MIDNTDGKNPSPSEQPEANPNTEQPNNAPDIPDWVKDPVNAYREISKLRDENKSRREKEAELEKQQAAAKEALLIEQNQFKELAEQRAKQLADLQPQAQEAETYKQIIDKMLEARLEAAPEHIKSLLSELPSLKALEWLETNADKLAPRQAPNLDAGKSGVQEKAIVLTEEQEMYVKRMKLNRDEYIKNLTAELNK